jgi:hypothetical protein
MFGSSWFVWCLRPSYPTSRRSASPKLLGLLQAIREARWNGWELAPRTVVGWCLADDVAEGSAERPETGKADIEADVSHAAIAAAEQEHRSFDATALKIAMRRLAEGRPKGADEMCLRRMGDAGQLADIERLGIGQVHDVAGAEHPPVGFFDGTAHSDMIAQSPDR